MALPEIHELEEILSGISLSPDRPPAESGAVRLPLMPASDHSGRIASESPLWLSYPQKTKLSFASLAGRIGKELRAHNHSDSENFVLFVLAYAALLRSASLSGVRAVNAVLSTICVADVNLYFALMAELPEYHQYQIAPFRLGRLRTDKLKWNCEKAQSDFFERYRTVLQRSWSVEREPKTTNILDISDIRKKIFSSPLALNNAEPWRLKAWESLVNGYFSHLNQALFISFWDEFITAQDALLTMGGPFVDPRDFASVIQAMQIAVFLNFGSERGGFVAPAGHGPIAVDLANAHERVPNIVSALKDEFEFTQFDASPLNNSIKLFASFVARARRHQISGRMNESLIHYVIALELIFGERQSIQKSVSERVAVILFSASGVSFNEHMSWVDGLYDTRSRYVHSGKTAGVDDALLDRVRRACDDCFRCLLRLRKQSPDQSENALAKWLGSLDYLAKGMIAGKTFDDNELKHTHLLPLR